MLAEDEALTPAILVPGPLSFETLPTFWFMNTGIWARPRLRPLLWWDASTAQRLADCNGGLGLVQAGIDNGSNELDDSDWWCGVHDEVN